MRGRGSAGRASPCQGEGRGFESRRPLGASLAQSLWGEMFSGWSGREARQRTANPCTRVQIPSPPRAIGAVGARFPDTEEVTGSNPVSPTSITPGQSQVPGSQPVSGAGFKTVAYLTAYLSPRLLMREESVHRARTAGEHRPQLLAVHQLGDAAAGVAN